MTAVGEGIAVITAKAPNGKTAACRVRVIKPMIVNLTGGGRWGRTGQEGRKWDVTDISYTQEELESYVNNIEDLFKTDEGQERFSEAQRHTVSIRDSLDEPWRSVVKPAGELAINNYLAVITTRNQMFYGFKKDAYGEWHLDLVSTTSTGNATKSDHFKMYLRGPRNEDGNGGTYGAPIFVEGVIGGTLDLGNVFHPSWIAGEGEDPTPSSHGCVHLGNANGKLYKWVTKANGGLRVIYVGPTRSYETTIPDAYDKQGYNVLKK